MSNDRRNRSKSSRRPGGELTESQYWDTPPRTSFDLSLRDEILELVHYVRAARQLRTHFLDAQLFGEPGWDLLLDLYDAELGQRRVQIGGACIGSGVAATTALRWLHTMESRGLIHRVNDPTDGRRVFVYLSVAAVSSMDQLFERLRLRLSALQRGR